MASCDSNKGSTSGDGSGLNKTDEKNDWYDDCDMRLVLGEVKVGVDVVEGILEKEVVRVRKLIPHSVRLARLFKKLPTKNVLKVFHVGRLREGHYAITEPLHKFEDWIKSNKPIDSSGEWNYDTFIRPFQSLMENVLSVLAAMGDFKLNASNIVVVTRENGRVELKIGLSELTLLRKANPKDEITCFHHLCMIVENWVGARSPGTKRCRGLYLLLEDMKSLKYSLFIPDRVHHLRFILMHPMFIPDARKGEMFDLIFKVDWIRRMVGVKILGTEQFTSDLMSALSGMEVKCGGTPHLPCIRKQTIWFDRASSNNSFKKWFKNVLQEDPTSKFLTFRFMIRSLRNFWAHLEENIACGDSIVSCVETVDKFCPGFWHALHHAVLTSSLLKEFVEDRWFISLDVRP